MSLGQRMEWNWIWQEMCDLMHLPIMETTIWLYQMFNNWMQDNTDVLLKTVWIPRLHPQRPYQYNVSVKVVYLCNVLVFTTVLFQFLSALITNSIYRCYWQSQWCYTWSSSMDYIYVLDIEGNSVKFVFRFFSFFFSNFWLAVSVIKGS